MIDKPNKIEFIGKNDDELKDIYTKNQKYLSNFHNKGFLASHFLNNYHDSLFYYKHFYDDLNEFGNPKTCDNVFYFIPGFNGTPGQIKFGIPGIIRKFGSNVYIKSLFLEEFSCKLPYWVKFTKKHLEMKRKQIIKDLEELTKSYGKVRIVASSSGFYDFLATFPHLKSIKDNLSFFWVSCSPDRVSESKWEKIFYKINGFTFDNMKWFSYPNLQCLKYLNPECGTKLFWKYKNQKNIFYKNDLESRFYCFNFLWDYISTDCFNFVLQNNLDIFKKSTEMIDIETHILAATKDGFWDDSSQENIEKTLNSYIKKKRIIYKKTSHLWVATPENLYELLV